MSPSERHERIVVVGGVSAGMSAASQARRRAPEADVVLLESGSFVSYGTCGIPYNISDPTRNVDDLVVLSAEEALDKRRIDVRVGYRVTAIDLEAPAVYTTDTNSGREYSIGFDRLILATGAEPLQPGVDGVDLLEGIFPVRDLGHAAAIKAYVAAKSPKNALIIGAGSSGLEIAYALRALGINVTLIDRATELLSNFGTTVAKVVERELEANQVQLRKGCSVLFFKGDGGRVTGVETTQGNLDAELVIFATGFKPRSELAAAAGIRLGANDAIEVDRAQRTSAPNVFAAGDCATVHHRMLGGNTYFPLGVIATRQGRVAGANAAGGNELFAGTVGTMIFKVFDQQVARTGLTEAQALQQGYQVSQTTIRTKTRGHSAPGTLDIALTLLYDERSGRVLGANLVGGEEVSRRVDVLAAALYSEHVLDDLVNLDLSYTPPLSPVWDPIIVAATVARKTITSE